jgi:hypothetical protein
MAGAEIVGRDLDAKRAQLVQDSSSQTTDGAGDERHPPPTVGGPNKAAGGPRKIPDHRVSGSWQPDGPGFQLVNGDGLLELGWLLDFFWAHSERSLGAISWGNLLGQSLGAISWGARPKALGFRTQVGGLARCFGLRDLLSQHAPLGRLLRGNAPGGGTVTTGTSLSSGNAA